MDEGTSLDDSGTSLDTKGPLANPDLVVARSVLPALRFCVCDPYGTILALQWNI